MKKDTLKRCMYSFFLIAAASSLLGCTTTYPHANEAIGTVRSVYDGNLMPDLAVSTFRNTDRLFESSIVQRSSSPSLLPLADKPLGPLRFTSRGRSYDLVDYVTLNSVTGLLILKDGKVLHESYYRGNNEKTRWMSMSVAKSITSTLIGAAVKDGDISSINDPVTKYVIPLIGTAYEGVSIKDVLMMASGAKWREAYTDPTSDRRALLEAQIKQTPGASLEVLKAVPRAAMPGSVWAYSTGETQIAAELLRSAVKKPLAQYAREKIWNPAGMESDATWWLDSHDGVEIGGSGFSATLRDYGRFGQFLLNKGVVNGAQILPSTWVDEATSAKINPTSPPAPPGMSYGYLWWVGGSEQATGDKAFVAMGIFGQAIYINPKKNLVIVKWGAQSKPTGTASIDDSAFFDAVATGTDKR